MGFVSVCLAACSISRSIYNLWFHFGAGNSSASDVKYGNGDAKTLQAKLGLEHLIAPTRPSNGGKSSAGILDFECIEFQ